MKCVTATPSHHCTVVFFVCLFRDLSLLLPRFCCCITVSSLCVLVCGVTVTALNLQSIGCGSDSLQGVENDVGSDTADLTMTDRITRPDSGGLKSDENAWQAVTDLTLMDLSSFLILLCSPGSEVMMLGIKSMAEIEWQDQVPGIAKLAAALVAMPLSGFFFVWLGSIYTGKAPAVENYCQLSQHLSFGH